MKPTIKKLTAIYFSATDTTRRCADAIAESIGAESCIRMNLADDIDMSFPDFSGEDVVLVASPVYGGRLPEQVSRALQRISGHDAKAIAIVVYGNRDYDDALLELTDLLRSASFRIIGQGAFIGRHSIFPKVGESRPDADDITQLHEFGKECRNAILSDTLFGLPSPHGKRPYKKAAGVPLHPHAEINVCTRCATCASRCPVGAIPRDRPYSTDNKACISCGRCISVCPHGARRYSGIAYTIIGALFKAAFSKRKHPRWEVATESQC